MAAYLSFQPSDHFSTKLYTGNSNAGSSNTQSITGVGFQPDFTWIKNYESASNYAMFDAVRGATKFVSSNDTSVEETVADTLTAFGADGFTLGTDLTQGVVNNLNETFVSWNWKAGGAGSANSDGSITSTVSVNTTSGFSIVKWTGNSTAGATIGHGLGVKPSLIIIKNLGGTSNWLTWWDSFANTEMLYLNLDNAKGTGQTYFNSTTPTDTLITLGSGVDENQNDMVAYCFTAKNGYSKFGSYFGNSSNDGPFIYTGFRPKMVITKGASTGDSWMIFGKNPPYNIIDRYLKLDTNAADQTNVVPGDFCSTGFRVRDDDNKINQGNTYMYAAFAEFPIVSSNDIPGLAR